MAIDDIRKEELKNLLIPYVESITTPDEKAGKNKYKCPLCNSGYGKNGTGAFTVYPETNSWYCFSCGKGGEIYELVGEYENIGTEDDTFPERFRIVEEFAGLPSISDYKAKKDPNKANAKKQEISEADRRRFARARKDYIDRCTLLISKTDYFAKRGFNETEVKRFRLGYDPDHKGRPGIVIPYNDEDEYYNVRYIDEKADKKEYQKYDVPLTEQAGGRRTFNKSALYEKKPCFLCEGELNALSILAVASDVCNAVALGSSTNAKRIFIDDLKQKKPECTLILSVDPDEAGEKALHVIVPALQEMNIPYITALYSYEAYPEGKRKDPNDFLVADRSLLRKDILRNVEAAEDDKTLTQEISSEVYEEYAKFIEEHNGKNAKELLKDFLEGVSGSANTPVIRTGFPKLDDELDGGLYPGLYILGAISSLGKTTFLLQMADQIAEAGHDVLFISMEMDSKELISKSLSRLTYMHSYESTRNAKTSRGITSAERYKNYSQEEKALIQIAVQHYKRYAGNIYIYEGIGDMGVKEIREIVEKHKDTSVTGKAPVVMIDYLQILAPYDMRASDKQNTDKAVVELKRISRDFHTPVIAVSSFNRDNYENEVTFSAFKESGAIEYGSDVLLALQPQGMKPGYDKKDQRSNAALVKKCKASQNRKVEVVVLKNRNGKTGGKVGYNYRTLFNCFETDYNYVPNENEE